MEYQRSIKLERLKLRKNDNGITHLSVYLFYILGEGYMLEVWPVKETEKATQNPQDNYFGNPEYLGKCITLVKYSGDESLNKAHEKLAIELYPKEKEKLAKEILEKYGWELE